MLGRAAHRHSSCCRVDRKHLGPDCTDYSFDNQTQRRWERRRWQREVELELLEDEDFKTDPLT